MFAIVAVIRSNYGCNSITRRLLYSNAALCNKVELDTALREPFLEKVYKPRKHPGVSKVKTVSLPPELIKSIRIVLEDSSSKAFYQESLKLSNYLRSRLPPPEQGEIDATAAKLYEKMNKNKLEIAATEMEKEKNVRDINVKLFNSLKKRVYSWANIAYDEPSCLQYLMARAAAEYAVLCRVLDEIDRDFAGYTPRSFFDFGSGVGTGTWAINNYWRNTLFEYFCVDTSPAMHDLARLILCGGRENSELPLKGYFQRQFLPASSNLKYSIVLSAYSLFELPNRKSRLETIQKLWNKTEDFLIVVEQGTNAGFKLVNETRDFILDLPKGENSGYVFAPCPNDNICPRYLQHETPCNFLMRYSTLPFPSKSEIKAELFSYVILKKGNRPEGDKQWPRIVRPPIVRSKHTICRMCTSQGELQEVIFTKSKHDQQTYRCARSSCWGDLLPVKVHHTAAAHKSEDPKLESELVDPADSDR